MKFEVEGSESNPAYSGFIELDVTPHQLFIRWLGEEPWSVLDWWEILLLLRQPIPQIQDQMKELRDEAREAGYNDGLKAGFENAAKEKIGCGSETNRATIPPMKKKKSSTAKAAKARKATPKLKKKAAAPKLNKRAAVPKAITRKKGPVAVTSGTTQYDKQVFVRFETPQLKELVRAAADASNASMNAYIAYFAVEAASASKKLPSATQEAAVAAAG